MASQLPINAQVHDARWTQALHSRPRLLKFQPRDLKRMADEAKDSAVLVGQTDPAYDTYASMAQEYLAAAQLVEEHQLLYPG